MADYPFDMQLVVDPLNPSTVVAEGAVYIYDPADTTFSSPLPITNLQGVPIENPLESSPTGYIDEFVAQVPQVVWKSGQYTGLFNSFKGMRDEAIAAKEAAEASALYAEAVANGMTIGVVTSGSAPAVTMTDEAPYRKLNFVLPQGPTGPQGPAGSMGLLDELTDVNAPTPGDGQYLQWNATEGKWKAVTLATPASTLDSLTDVTAASPSNGQVLTWDSATSQWKAVAPAAVGSKVTVATTAPASPAVGDVWFDIS